MSDYLLGDRDPELDRLERQHELWSESTCALWERAHIVAGDTVADLGCGPGATCLELAARVAPGGRVLAIDASEKALARVRERGRHAAAAVEPVHADLEAWSPDPGSLDSAFARWSFCFLSDPRRLLEATARGLRSGGSLAVFDYARYDAFAFHPESEAQKTARRAVLRSWSATGGDLEVAATLPGWGTSCSLATEWIDLETRIARPGEPLWSWPRRFFEGFAPKLVSDGLLDDATAAALFADWDALEQTPGAFVILPPMLRLVLRKV